MRRSKLLLPLLKENPQEAQVPSHRLMLRAGLINQTASGIYSWLPLGHRVLRNVENIIEDELNKAGCQRLTLPTVQPAKLWQESGRYDAYGKEMLRIKDRHERDMLYGPTAEEVVNDIIRQHVTSYKQLPMNLYQINWKFRDEIRPRFGVMRGREFFMKDGYSFHLTKEDALREYEDMFNCYMRILNRIFEGIPNVRPIAVKADPGPIGGEYSHEFQIPADTGESDIYFEEAYTKTKDYTYKGLKDLYAAADELHDLKKAEGKKLVHKKGIEVGHIFYVGSEKYSESMGIKVPDAKGNLIYPKMGTYGIGVTRIVGAIIEASHDDRGIIWSKSVTPYLVGIINLLKDDLDPADTLYKNLISHGIEVLLDDRLDQSPGAKFSEMDLIGVPIQVIVGKTYTESQSFEVKDRRTGERMQMSMEKILDFLHSTSNILPCFLN